VPARRQLRLLPRLSPTDFRRAIQAADVIVDPLHWSGGNTALDTLAAGTPVVTVPGPLMRSRQASAMLRRLDASECIAATPSEAAMLAVRVAHEAGLRDALRSRISANGARLFSDGAPVARLAEHLASLVH
jgi:CRISPR-associated protein Csy1